MNAPVKLPTRKCRICHEPYVQFNSLKPTCGKYECQVAFGLKHAEKAEAARLRKERRETREAKLKIKTRQQWLKEAQSEFNRYIRLRDADKPCISCQRFHSGQYHAGHYRSVGSCPELRFEECNVHKQCSACNNHLSGNVVLYRIGLIARIGEPMVEWLEGAHEPLKLAIQQIQAIKSLYKAKCKELQQ